MGRRQQPGSLENLVALHARALSILSKLRTRVCRRCLRIEQGLAHSKIRAQAQGGDSRRGGYGWLGARVEHGQESLANLSDAG